MINYWPEVLDGVKLNSLPIQYLRSVHVNFKNSLIWEIVLTEETKKNGWSEFERTLSNIMSEYEPIIENIEFKLDIKKVKRDVKKKTNKFLKKYKL